LDQGIYIAASGSLKQEKMMEALANNLANVNTSGFKKDLLAFEAISSDFNKTAQTGPKPISFSKGFGKDKNLYPALATLKTDFSPGQVVKTGNPLDIAIEGQGFLEVQTNEGPRYIRSGSFRFNQKRELTTPDGDLVMGQTGPIMIAPASQDFSIDKDGQIIVSNGSGATPVGNLKIVDFPDYGVLEKSGVNYFKETGQKSTAKPAENFEVLQGGLESSNVNVAMEMVRMIEVTRGYESYQKVIQSIDNLNNKAVNEVSRIA
jgi:flagellar basal-body rod protein FlgG